LAQLAAVLRKEGYEHVKIVDAWAEDLTEPAFLEAVESFNPNLVGCTLWTTNLNSELLILKKIKEQLPGITAVAGGPHLDVFPRETLEHSDLIDIGVVGEGEETVVELFDALRTDAQSLSEIKGIVYREGKEIVFTGRRPLVKDLDSLPYPDFSGLPVNNYYSDVEKTAPFIYIFSARGCPYNCRYCLNSIRGRREHSIDYVIDYVKHMKRQYGIKEVAFYDETFTFDKKRTLLFCERYEEDIGLPYTIRTRVNHVDEETIVALKESGCYRINYGVESGTQEVLDKMNRKISLEQVREAIALTKKHGVSAATNFMIGYLDESKDTYERTIKFIKELDPDSVNLFITTVLPGTDLHSEVFERGIIKQDLWREYALGKIPTVEPKGLRIPGKDYGVDDLDQMLAQAYRRIYFRPRFILKKLRALRSPARLKRYLVQAKTMLLANTANPQKKPQRE
jgi:anaerobic magnesium-protoporphyrin IX monomethyl ester cyclase